LVGGGLFDGELYVGIGVGEDNIFVVALPALLGASGVRLKVESAK